MVVKMEDREECNGRECVAPMGKRAVRTGFWWGDLMEGNHFEYLGLDGRLILK